MMCDLATAIIRYGKVPTDREQFHCLPLQGQGRCSGKAMSLKILERIVDGLIRKVVSIDDSQFGFVQGRGTTDAAFVV